MKKELAILAVAVVVLIFLIEPAINKEGEKGMNEIVVLETTKGNIEMRLDSVKAPVTTANFLRYVNDGFYNSTIFHRVIPGFMIQGGGFTLNGKEKPTHESIKLESNNGLKNRRGTIAMARTSDPDSATSQFFINVVDNDFLDYTPGNDGYTVFGNVIKGMDVVDASVAVKTSDKEGFSNWPLEDIIIKGSYVKK